MDLGIRGKRALISGSTAGIGRAIAVALAREGARVVINGRSAARVEAAVLSIVHEVHGAVPGAAHAPDVSGVAADLGTREGAEAVFAVVPEVDILVNNLGIFEPRRFEAIPDEDWRRFFEVNVLSGVRLARQYLPGMRSRDWGRVIFVSSESGVQVPAEMIHYGMTKTAQIAVARGLAETTAGTRVTVNSVLPGPTRSEGVGVFVDDLAKAKGIDAAAVEADFFKSVRPSSLLKRFATTAEVANLVAYVASELSSATNGAALRCDGGVIRSIL